MVFAGLSLFFARAAKAYQHESTVPWREEPVACLFRACSAGCWLRESWHEAEGDMILLQCPAISCSRHINRPLDRGSSLEVSPLHRHPQGWEQARERIENRIR